MKIGISAKKKNRNGQKYKLLLKNKLTLKRKKNERGGGEVIRYRPTPPEKEHKSKTIIT